MGLPVGDGTFSFLDDFEYFDVFELFYSDVDYDSVVALSEEVLELLKNFLVLKAIIRPFLVFSSL